ncbi:hypothetical protein [Nodularia sp. NIES-3585]|uniref:hypothetical protein n=1 Tax=Nodularia sp. NIES-3585 TaxID=1973477 RepID=UPI000B5D0537|nr:hypothetical protein [Nodularia sp. NIES-3585]GAX37877.1 hypothetical protein NIES3585_39220 [Nodularia sp. NIES-3585]
MNESPWLVYSDNVLPWLVYSDHPVHLYRVVCRFSTRPQAEMHAQSLNRLTRGVGYKVCCETQVKTSA